MKVKEVNLLIDYRNNFLSKRNDNPYRSGLDINSLKNYFNDHGIKIAVKNFSQVDFSKKYSRQDIFLYTSSEDNNLKYKNYIEDIIYGLELANASIIPDYKYLKAHENKVFMEILRQIALDDLKPKIETRFYGCYEEYVDFDEKKYPQVIKLASGSLSKNIALINNIVDTKKIRSLTNSFNSIQYIKDVGRTFKYKGYKKESYKRNKFIIQEFLKDLEFDYKVLIFGEKYYVLKRFVRKNDFRASGSGKFVFDKDVPFEVLDYANKIYNEFNIPSISLDIAIKDEKCYLLEFQGIHFGTTTLVLSPFYFKKKNEVWERFDESSILEKEFVDSIVQYLENLEI